MVCNSGVGLTPVIDGELHQFSAGGLFNGLVLMIDDETETYWDHITGEAVHGALLGKKMDYWPLDVTTVAAACERDPEITLSLSKPSLMSRLMGLTIGRQLRGRGFMPPTFRATMQTADDRLSTMAHGLGIVVDGSARFYPMERVKEGIDETWLGRKLNVRIDELDRTPVARWETGERPFQLLTRWYGFSYTFPDCEIFEV